MHIASSAGVLGVLLMRCISLEGEERGRYVFPISPPPSQEESPLDKNTPQILFLPLNAPMPCGTQAALVAEQSVSKFSHVTSLKMREMRGEVGKKTPKRDG